MERNRIVFDSHQRRCNQRTPSASSRIQRLGNQWPCGSPSKTSVLFLSCHDHDDDHHRRRRRRHHHRRGRYHGRRRRRRHTGEMFNLDAVTVHWPLRSAPTEERNDAGPEERSRRPEARKSAAGRRFRRLSSTKVEDAWPLRSIFHIFRCFNLQTTPANDQQHPKNDPKGSHRSIKKKPAGSMNQSIIFRES